MLKFESLEWNWVWQTQCGFLLTGSERPRKYFSLDSNDANFTIVHKQNILSVLKYFSFPTIAVWTQKSLYRKNEKKKCIHIPATQGEQK